MQPDVQEAISRIHASSTSAVLYAAGGASHASSWLLSVPGASKTVLEVCVPYARAAFRELLVERSAAIQSFASMNSARALAAVAFRRAVALAPPGARVCGLAATCALVSVEEQQGVHRAYVASHSRERVVEYELRMQTGTRDRWQEELLSSRLVIQALLDHTAFVKCPASSGEGADRVVMALDQVSLSGESPMSLVREHLFGGDVLDGPRVYEQPDAVDALLAGDIRFVEFFRGVANPDATSATVLLPGSFNPLHHGHEQLLNVAHILCPNANVAYELSAFNPDKPPLDADVIRARVAQFEEKDVPVVVTNAPLFSTKAELLPNSSFVVGADTALRLVMPKYYGGEDAMVAALTMMLAKGCTVFVGGRLGQGDKSQENSRFLTLKDVHVPPGLSALFREIPADMFRADISSSEIRKALGWKGDSSAK